MFFKKKIIPNVTKTVELDAVELWGVRWGLDDYFNRASANIEAEFFTNEEDALKFKNSLVNAVKLLKFKGRYEIKLQKEAGK